jgi:pimeloyl-ACP methyl ester carboxylesterase
MVEILKGIFSDPKWWTDEEYVRQRHAWTLEPGVWEACAAARFKAPHIPPRPSYGQPDSIPYENIDIPTLLVVGDEDKLRLPGYGNELNERIKGSELYVFKNTGHCPNIERAEEFNALVLAFLDRMEQSKPR